MKVVHLRRALLSAGAAAIVAATTPTQASAQDTTQGTGQTVVPQTVVPATTAATDIDANKLIGRWLNTDRATQGVAEIVIDQEGDHFYVSIKGVGDSELIPWPRTRATPLANLEEEAGQRALAFAVNFDFEFMTVESYLRVNKGVLVIVGYYTFRDRTRRSNYVNREFFYRHV